MPSLPSSSPPPRPLPRPSPSGVFSHNVYCVIHDAARRGVPRGLGTPPPSPPFPPRLHTVARRGALCGARRGALCGAPWRSVACSVAEPFGTPPPPPASASVPCQQTTPPPPLPLPKILCTTPCVFRLYKQQAPLINCSLVRTSNEQMNFSSPSHTTPSLPLYMYRPFFRKCFSQVVSQFCNAHK